MAAEDSLLERALEANGCTRVSAAPMNFNDVTPPTIICPANQSVCVGDSVFYQNPTFSDNCFLGNNQPILMAGLPSGVLRVKLFERFYFIHDLFSRRFFLFL
jgi:hypothetical protein